MTDRNYRARVDTFNSLLNKYTSLHPEFDTDLWRSYFKSLADRESDFQANIPNKIGAYGYFLLMPANLKRSKNRNNPGALFEDVFDLTRANLNYLKKNMTPEDYAKAQSMGIDMYGLAAGAHLGGAKGMLNYIRSRKNPQDYNGTKISYYARDFSQNPKVKTGALLGNWSVEGQAVRFEDVMNGTSVLTGDTPRNSLLSIVSNINNSLNDESTVSYLLPNTTKDSLDVWRSRIPKDVVIEETKPPQDNTETQDNNKDTLLQDRFKSLVRYGVPELRTQEPQILYIDDPLKTVLNVWDTYNTIYDELFSRDSFKERERALGGPININNPILNFSYFKGLLPIVRYSLGGRLHDSIIPSSNSVKPNLFYDGGDTMTSQFLDQVLAAREANLLRNEELAALYNFSPLAISDILLGRDVNVYTPDVVVTGKAPSVGFYPYGYYSPNKGINYDGLSKGVLEMTPVIGDAMEIGNIGDDLYKGNYTQAGIGLGLMALPNILEKPVKYAGRKLHDLYNISNYSRSELLYDAKELQKFRASLFILGLEVPYYDKKQSIQSLDPEAYQNIMHLVVDRNIQEFTKAGVPQKSIDIYKAKAQLILDNIKVGKYSANDYEEAGMRSTNGFYNYFSNPYFISTRRDADPLHIQSHETRHAMDYLLDDEILNPTPRYDKETTDLLEKLKLVKYNLNHILGQAYDDDFINLPNTKYAGSIKGYPYMDRDKITTNLDARNELIKIMLRGNPELDVNNLLSINWGIDKYPDNAIFLAVYDANGYGRRYIDFLDDNNKLTPEKAQQFREAMKYVGASAAPIGIWATTATSLDNKQHAFGGHLNKFEEGGNTNDTKYQAFLKDLKKHAPNLANPSKDYNMRRYWELKGKPSNWEEAQRDWNYLYNVKEDPVFYLEDDGSYHATSTALNLNTGIGEFMKSANHPTVQYELNWYDNGDETGPNRLRLPSFEGFKSSQEFKQGNKYTPGYELKYSPIENKYYYIPKYNKL